MFNLNKQPKIFNPPFLKLKKSVSFDFGFGGLTLKLNVYRTVRIFTFKYLGRKLKFTLAKLSNIIRLMKQPEANATEPLIRNFMLSSGNKPYSLC